jgi:hypothetical protein
MEVWKKRRKEMENLGFMGEMCLAQGKRIKWLSHKKAGGPREKKRDEILIC